MDDFGVDVFRPWRGGRTWVPVMASSHLPMVAVDPAMPWMQSRPQGAHSFGVTETVAPASGATRRRLRLPVPSGGTEPDSRRCSGRSATPSLQQFQELAFRCEDEADESISTCEVECRSQASTVPLESVDAFVQSASELAVEALKLGKTSEAQKIMRLADGLYEQNGVSIHSGKRSDQGPAGQLPRCPSAFSSSRSKSGMVSTLRELAMLVGDDEGAHASFTLSQAESRGRQRRLQRDADFQNASLRSSRHQPRPTAARHFSEDAWEVSDHRSMLSEHKKLSALTPPTALPVVHVYGTAFFGAAHGVASVPMSAQSPATRPSTVQGEHSMSSTELAMQAKYILDMESSRTHSMRPRDVVWLRPSEQWRDVEHTKTQKDAAQSAGRDRIPPCSGPRGSVKGGLLPCMHEAGKLAPCTEHRSHEALEVNKTWIPSSPPPFTEEPTAAASSCQRRESMTLQSLEDTWGLKKLIKMAAVRRELSSSPPNDESVDDMDDFVRTTIAQQVCLATRAGRCQQLDQSAAANPNKEDLNPRPDSVDLGTLPASPFTAPCQNSADEHVSVPVINTRAGVFRDSTAAGDRVGSMSYTHAEESGDEDDSDKSFLGQKSFSLTLPSTTESTPRSVLSHLSLERSVLENSYQHQRLVNTLQGRRLLSCCMIQCAIRMAIARRRTQQARDARSQARMWRRHSAALVIQSMFWSVQMRARKRASDMMEAIDDQHQQVVVVAAAILTSFGRLVLARKAVRQAERQRGLDLFFAGLTDIFGGSDATSTSTSTNDPRTAPVVMIQTSVRRWFARRTTQPALRRRHVQLAVLALQQCYRAHAARRECRALKFARLCHRRAAMLQAAWHCHASRAQYRGLRRAKRADVAACVLQRACRAHAARRELEWLRDLPTKWAKDRHELLRRREAAARHIQRVVRGGAGRRRARRLAHVLQRDEVEFCQHLMDCRRRMAHEFCGGDAEEEEARHGTDDTSDPASWWPLRRATLCLSSAERRACLSSTEDALAKARVFAATVALDESGGDCNPEDAQLCAGSVSMAASASAFELSLSPVLGSAAGADLHVPRHSILANVVASKLQHQHQHQHQHRQRHQQQQQHQQADLQTLAHDLYACKLQAVYRGHQARNLMRRLLCTLAAVRLERAWRGHRGRKESRHVSEGAAAAAAHAVAAAAQSRTDAGARAAHGLTSLESVTAPSRSSFKAANSSPDSWAAALACSGAAESEAAASRYCGDEDAPALGCASVVGSPTRARERRVFQSSGEALRSLSMPAQGHYVHQRAC